ncbi:MAG: HAMP domain-containing protein [Clostridia bacterium]|nr:HAMP domain-containing protein [Clostridia bacterium]
MKKSFRLKVVAVFLVGTLLSMIILTFLSSVFLRPIFISNSKKNMESYAVQIDKCLMNNSDDVSSLLSEINMSYGITTHVTDENGKILHSYTKIKINNSLSGKYRKWINFYYEKDIDENYYFRERLDESDNIKKIIYVGKSTDGKFIIMNKSIKGIEQDIRIVSIFIIIMGVTVAVLGTAVWSIFTKSFTDNIKKMSEITQKMSELNFDEKINHKSNDEIGTLANSIDVLSDELKTSIEGLRDDVERRKRLIRDISHELKTPITTVKGYIENIQVLTQDDKKLKRYCEIAAEECDAIDELVEEMLEMSRLEGDGYVCDMEDVNALEISAIINNKLDNEFRSQKIDIGFDSAVIHCNSTLISRAVINFVKNAVKYGNKDSEIRIRGISEKDRYVFSVTNDGAHISDEEKALLWELFYKTDKARKRDKSYGIGLSMVHRIAELHGGNVGVESEKGKNTFYLWLPLNK